MRSARLTGLALLLTAAALYVGGTYADPGMESGDDARAFGQEAIEAAARAPAMFVAQAVQISLAVLAVLAGAGLWALVRRTAPAAAVAGTGALALAGVLSAVQGMVGVAVVATADSYTNGGLVAAGDPRSLELIRALGLIHWASWLATAVALGTALLTFGWALAWAVRLAPRWLGVAGVFAGALLVLSPLVLLVEVYYLGLMAGTVLALGWLGVTAVVLIVRPGRSAPPAPGQRPVHRGWRFSTKALARRTRVPG